MITLIVYALIYKYWWVILIGLGIYCYIAEKLE